MQEKAKILVVEDETAIREGLIDVLVFHGFDVEWATTGTEGLEKALTGNFDLLLLDVMLPGLDGFEICDRVRARDTETPIIMLTARSGDEDTIHGLRLGADDYVAKPCTPRELVARLRAILRRAAPTARRDDRRPVEIGALRIEPASRQASWRGATLELTSSEFNLLEQLARGVGRVVSKEELSERALARKLTRYDRSIDVHISHLRTKLGELPDGRSPIQTVRGVGYQLVADPR